MALLAWLDKLRKINFDAGHKIRDAKYIDNHACTRSSSFRSISLGKGPIRWTKRGSIKWTYGTVVERGTGYGDRGERGRGGLRASCGLDVACDCGIRGCGCCCGGGARAVHVNRTRRIGRRKRPALRPTVSAGRVRRRRRESGLRCGRLVVVHHCNEPASMFTLLTRSQTRTLKRYDEDEPRRGSTSSFAECAGIFVDLFSTNFIKSSITVAKCW